MDNSTLNFIYFLSVIGGLTLTVLISKLLWTIIKIILPSKNYLNRYGKSSWVIVADIVNKIGVGFCQQFARMGFNICIIGRNQQQIISILDNIKLLNTDNTILTDYMIVDFNLVMNERFFGEMFEDLKKKRILQNLAILVNNVQIYNVGFLHEISDQKLINQIIINCIPCVLMSNYTIPYMLRRQKRSAIINISSIVSKYGIPYYTTYSATKSFIDIFSQTLSIEYQNKIDIISLKPISISQNDIFKGSFGFIAGNKNQCASSTIRMLGLGYETNGYWVQEFASSLVSLLPKSLIRGILEWKSKKVLMNEVQTKITQ